MCVCVGGGGVCTCVCVCAGGVWGGDVRRGAGVGGGVLGKVGGGWVYVVALSLWRFQH